MVKFWKRDSRVFTITASEARRSTRVGFNQHALRGIRACVRSRVTADTCTPEAGVESAIPDFGDELFGPVVREKWRINY